MNTLELARPDDFDICCGIIDMGREFQKKQEPYAVVHRMAFSSAFRGVGLADETFRLIEALCARKKISNIRVDTDFINERMKHILKKNGYALCGVIPFQGSRKLAFDKIL